VSNMNGTGIPDLGAIKQRQREKEQTPPYTIGNPEFAVPVGVDPTGEDLSYRAALDQAATVLGKDGFTITEAKNCQFMGAEAQQGKLIFQIVVSVTEHQA
jgi:hypothetical protein